MVAPMPPHQTVRDLAGRRVGRRRGPGSHVSEVGVVVKLWKDNRVDAEYEMDPADVAAGFLASRWAGVRWPLERRLRAYMTAKEADGGLSSVWEDETGDGFGAVLAAIRGPRRVEGVPVVHIGPRPAEQVGYDLAWEARLGRADDWRREACVTPRLARALAAEQRRQIRGGTAS
jgi:hypothetical protein